MDTSLSSILTSIQQLTQAANGIAQTYLSVQGLRNTPGISAATLVTASAGRLAMVSVTTAGSAPGVVYDTNAATSTLRPIYAIPNTLGIVFVNLPVAYGIVVAPGSGQAVTASWS